MPLGFDYDLPPERIAQHPPDRRDGARLMGVARGGGRPPMDSSILELPTWLRRGDLLVVNRSRVIPARLHGRRLPGGGGVELLLIAPSEDPVGRDAANRASSSRIATRWRALARPARRLRVGQRLELSPRRFSEPGSGLAPEGRPPVEVELASIGDGSVELDFPPGMDVLGLIGEIGEVPLPPYIRRPDGPTAEDGARYQTVFADEPGSIAAPTAGLHLSPRVLDALEEAGVRVATLLLHVGPATFLAGQPGRSSLTVEPERFEIPPRTRDEIRAAKERGRVIAVGTTTTRALETAARTGWPTGLQSTDLVLGPGAEFLVIDGLLTNFHLPGSSLLALVAGFAGVDCARNAYRQAVEGGYRFYSFGDAMLVI